MKILRNLELIVEGDVEKKWKARNRLDREGNRQPTVYMKTLDSGLEEHASVAIKLAFRQGVVSR